MQMGYKVCPNCGKQFWDNLENKRKFCCKQCRLRFNSRLHYHRKRKYDKEFVEKNLQKLLAWKEKKKQEKVTVGVENANPPAGAGGLLNGGETKC